VDQVLGLAAVYSSVRIIADMIASLPVNVYRYDSDGVPVKLTSSQLLDSPSIAGTLYDWLFMGTASALLHGNGVGYITSRTGVPAGASGLGLPATIEWLPMERVHIQDDEAQPWNPLRAKFFFDGRQLEREEIVHLRAFVVPGRTAAVSPLRAFATLISQGLGALDYSETWYKNGGFPPGTFQNTAEEVDRQQATEIRQRLTDTLRMHQPLVYGRDWEYKAISIPPNEAAFVESMQLNATQVAAIYGLPPERVGGKRGDSLTYSTEQQEVLAIITDTLRPWLARWEQLFKTLLPSTQFARFDVDQLLKTDLKTRYEIFQLQRNVGLRTADELRRMDDLPPLAGGVGADTIPLSVLERMSATTRAIPKSILNDVVLEQELAAELLLKLQGEGIVAPEEPGVPPVKAGPEAYLGRQLTLSRAAPLPAREKPAGDGGETPFGPRHQRATHNDRRRAHSWITDAHASGALDDDELNERVAAASAARVKGDLGDLVKDLPSEKELAAAGKQLADDPPNKNTVRSGDKPQHLFGQEAVTVLREMQFRWDREPDAFASLNGKAH
jgi:HK97 family phage portal protein